MIIRVRVKVTSNSPSQDYSHPDDHNLRTCDMTPGFKPFTVLHVFASNSDWSIALFTFVVIGRSNYFGFGSNENRSNTV